MKITKFDIQISKENVCHLINADKNSDLYEEIIEELEEMLPTAYEKIKPIALLEFGDFKEYADLVEEEGITEALYEINTIGREMGEWSTRLFAEGDYLGGMLVDAISDDYLFQMDMETQNVIKKICKERGHGIVRRLEAPQDVPMSIQKKAYDVTDAGNQIGLGIKESFMYDPVKSVCQVYMLDNNPTRFRSEHDCSKCTNYNCKSRNIPSVSVVVKNDDTDTEIRAVKSRTLLETLREAQIFVPALCAGRGTCGKCKIRVLEGNVVPSEADLNYFSEAEIEAGYRLACKAYPESDCTIVIGNREDEAFLVVADGQENESAPVKEDAEYGIAVDIGTTTIAMQLVELESGKIADVYTALNLQRTYGADVISRIEASNHGSKEELQKSIRKQLMEGVSKLTEDGKVRIQRMVIGGNTTMIHLLMGYSCETLGIYPFTPVNLDAIHTTYEEMFKEPFREPGAEFEIVIFPGISTYVGGDITAGLYALDFQNREKVAILVDLGTNGEMAIGNKEKIMVTSTAAGPAFEGGNIICGIGSVPGAISKVEIQNGEARVETIGGREPVGICGTGVIDTVHELVKEEIVDETGRMEAPYFEEGFSLGGEIRFYQKDVREIQLAKSAVRAGLETLISKYGVSYEEIDAIYVAGGFGYKMDIQKAVGIGLLPKACEEKIEAVGNSCLQGTVKYLRSETAKEETERLVQQSEEIQLSNDKKFQEFYMEYMYFESDDSEM